VTVVYNFKHRTSFVPKCRIRSIVTVSWSRDKFLVPDFRRLIQVTCQHKVSLQSTRQFERIVLLDYIHRLVSQKIEELKIYIPNITIHSPQNSHKGQLLTTEPLTWVHTHINP
jgi:hypothetical protein